MPGTEAGGSETLVHASEHPEEDLSPMMPVSTSGVHSVGLTRAQQIDVLEPRFHGSAPEEER